MHAFRKMQAHNIYIKKAQSKSRNFNVAELKIFQSFSWHPRIEKRKTLKLENILNKKKNFVTQTWE